MGSEDGAGVEAPALVATEEPAEPEEEEPTEGSVKQARLTEPELGSDLEPEQEEEELEEEEEPVAEEAKGARAAPKNKFDASAFRARQRRLRLVHAGSMVLAWLVAAPSGALAARYFKHTGALWFDAHRLLQGIAVAATLFGAALALGVLHPTLFGMGPHGTLGVCVIALSCLQPLNALYRPAKTAGKPRAAWKRLHAGMGWLTIGGGALNCLLGVRYMMAVEGDAAWPWFTALGFSACLPLAGAAVLASSRRSSVLPFSFTPTKSAKSTL